MSPSSVNDLSTFITKCFWGQFNPCEAVGSCEINTTLLTALVVFWSWEKWAYSVMLFFKAALRNGHTLRWLKKWGYSVPVYTLHYITEHIPELKKKGREQFILLDWERLRPSQLVVCVHLSGLNVGGMWAFVVSSHSRCRADGPACSCGDDSWMMVRPLDVCPHGHAKDTNEEWRRAKMITAPATLCAFWVWNITCVCVTNCPGPSGDHVCQDFILPWKVFAKIIEIMLEVTPCGLEMSKHWTWNTSLMRVNIVVCDTVRLSINLIPSKYRDGVIQIAFLNNHALSNCQMWANFNYL